MHDGFVAATLVLGLTPAVLLAVAFFWFRRTARRGRSRPH
jgi:hypothetical protein